MDKISSLLVSRRFWIAVAAVVAIVANELSPSIDTEELQSLILVAVSWIVGDSLRKTT